MVARLPLAPSPQSLDAVVLDTDGVIIDSAPRHAAAWKRAFDAVLPARAGQPPFDATDDYLRHVDGRSRLDGAAAFLASRGLELPAGLLELLGAVVDGDEARRLRLPGRPDPALFLEAASRLGSLPQDTAVVEDALAGVEAGRRGGFGLVVGVDRTKGPDSAAALRHHGADLVVSDPGELLVSGTDTPPADGNGR